MINPRRRDFAARNHHFSFTDDSDEAAAFMTWAEGIKTRSYSFGSKSDQSNPGGAWSRRLQRTKEEEEEEEEEEEKLTGRSRGSGSPSPKLWDQSADNPRAAAIARYREEMMDLVKDVPESAYELSLKDLVDLPVVASGQGNPEKGAADKEKSQKPGRKRISRSVSMDSGVFFLKLFLPFSMGGKRSNSSGSSGEREWWSKTEYGDRSSSSGSSNNSSIRSGSRKLTSCFSFLSRRNKARRI